MDLTKIFDGHDVTILNGHHEPYFYLFEILNLVDISDTTRWKKKLQAVDESFVLTDEKIKDLGISRSKSNIIIINMEAALYVLSNVSGGYKKFVKPYFSLVTQMINKETHEEMHENIDDKEMHAISHSIVRKSRRNILTSIFNKLSRLLHSWSGRASHVRLDNKDNENITVPIEVQEDNISTNIENIISSIPNGVSSVNTNNNDDDEGGLPSKIIYLLAVPAIISGQSTLMLKPGRTNNMNRRLKQYPIGTRILHKVHVANDRTAERTLLSYVKTIADKNAWTKHKNEYWDLHMVDCDVSGNANVQTIMKYMDTIKNIIY